MNYSYVSIDLDEVTGPERIAYAEQNAGKKVLSDIAKSEANNDAQEPGAAQYRQREPCQACDLKDEVKSKKKYGNREQPDYDTE